MRRMTQVECDEAGIMLAASKVNMASWTTMMFVMIIVAGIIAGVSTPQTPIAEATAKVALAK